MAKKGKSDSYTVYKTENRAFKNKVRKLERHVKKYPEDKIGKLNLERLLKDPSSYKIRTKPLNPGTNKTTPKVIGTPMSRVKTPAEQLSSLLGIPMPKTTSKRSRTKPSIVIKKRKDVKQS